MYQFGAKKMAIAVGTSKFLKNTHFHYPNLAAQKPWKIIKKRRFFDLCGLYRERYLHYGPHTLGCENNVDSVPE